MLINNLNKILFWVGKYTHVKVLWWFSKVHIPPKNTHDLVYLKLKMHPENKYIGVIEEYTNIYKNLLKLVKQDNWHGV